MMQKVRGAGLFVYVWVLLWENEWKVPQGREKKCGEGRK